MYLPSRDCPISLSVMSSEFTRAAARVTKSFLPQKPSIIPLCGLMHSSVDGHLGCFPLLAVVNVHGCRNACSRVSLYII